MNDLLKEAQELHDKLVEAIDRAEPERSVKQRAEQRAQLIEARDKVLEVLEEIDDSNFPVANVYTVAFVRYVEDPYEKLSERGKIKQVADEIQEALYNDGGMGGFFNVLSVQGATLAESDKILGVQR